MRISTKKTDLFHAKRLGYIVGPNVQLASPDVYVKQITDAIGLYPNMIEIKKKVTFEQGTSSKVLMINALQDEANQIDQDFCTAEFDSFQHTSYRRSSTSQRLAAMHMNEIINIKSRFETLCRMHPKDVVYVDNKKMIMETAKNWLRIRIITMKIPRLLRN